MLKKINIYSLFKIENLLILLMFVIGFKLSSSYFSFMELSFVSRILNLMLYALLMINALLITIKLLSNKLKLYKFLFSNWTIIVIAILLKLFTLFIQFPKAFLPGSDNFGYLIDFTSIVLILCILIIGLNTDQLIRKSIWALGMGLFTSSVIPLIMFPEMIGIRQSEFGTFTFTGGFWNVGVIGFISIGWLLIALSVKEQSIFKRVVLVLFILIIAFSGLAGLSRAIVVSIALSIITYLVFARKIKQYFLFIVVSILVVIIVTYSFNEVIENLAYRLDGGINIQEEARTTIWKTYIEYIPDYFLLGEIQGDYTKYTNWIFEPHSSLLNWFVQFGILGLIGFIMLLTGVFKSIRYIGKAHSRLISAPLYAWLIAYISVSFVNQTGFKDLSVFAAIGVIYAWGLNSYKKVNDIQ